MLLEFVEVVGFEDALLLSTRDVDEIFLHPLQVFGGDSRGLDADGVDVDAFVEKALGRREGLGSLGHRVDLSVRHHEEQLLDGDTRGSPIRRKHVQTRLKSLCTRKRNK